MTHVLDINVGLLDSDEQKRSIWYPALKAPMMIPPPWPVTLRQQGAGG